MGTSTGDIFAAIKTAWDSSSLNTRFTGGVYRDRRKAGDDSSPTPLPYVVVSDISGNYDSRSNKSVFWRHVIQFDVYDRTAELCEGHVAAIGDFLDENKVALASGKGHLMDVERIREAYMEEDKQVYRASVDYSITRRKPRP